MESGSSRILGCLGVLWRRCRVLKIWAILLVVGGTLPSPGRALICDCNTLECRRGGQTQCHSNLICYVQYLDRQIPKHVGRGSHDPITKGCYNGSSQPLMCHNKIPEIGLYSRIGRPWARVLCCSFHMCNSEKLKTADPAQLPNHPTSSARGRAHIPPTQGYNSISTYTSELGTSSSSETGVQRSRPTTVRSQVGTKLTVNAPSSSEPLNRRGSRHNHGNKSYDLVSSDDHLTQPEPPVPLGHVGGGGGRKWAGQGSSPRNPYRYQILIFGVIALLVMTVLVATLFYSPSTAASSMSHDYNLGEGGGPVYCHQGVGREHLYILVEGRSEGNNPSETTLTQKGLL